LLDYHLGGGGIYFFSLEMCFQLLKGDVILVFGDVFESFDQLLFF
jgi:hypothetical protein